MKLKVLAQAAVLFMLSAGVVWAGGGRVLTCDDCSEECLNAPYSKGCPPVCREPDCQAACDDCSDECRINPYAQGCPDICRDIECQACEDCSVDCKINPYEKTCPDICRDIKCYTCDDCSADCIKDPELPDCPPICDELGCNICDKFPRDCSADCQENPEDENCQAACEGIPDECVSADVVVPVTVTCDDCSVDCLIDPYGKGCPAECGYLDCNLCDKFPKDCPAICGEDPDDEDCPIECEEVPTSCLAAPPIVIEPDVVTCDDCPPACQDNPQGCAPECEELNCYPKKKKKCRPARRDSHLLIDTGYLSMSSESNDYLFGRVGGEFRPFSGGDFKDVSLIGMIGIASNLGSSSSGKEDALLADAFAQYNWSYASVDGFAGLGLGYWMSTGGETSNDAQDSGIDILANVGARVYGAPEGFNISVFLEARNAVDELGSIGNLGRFGIGIRFQL